jgi:glycerate 2-kinase
MRSSSLNTFSKISQGWLPGLNPHSLLESAHKETIQSVLLAALEAANPAWAIERTVRRIGNRLYIQDQVFDTHDLERIIIIAIGKASLPMTMAMANILGEQLSQAITLVKEGYSENHGIEKFEDCITVYEAGHPLPDERGVQASRQIEALLKDTTPNDLVICLISGGGSALLVTPVDGITLEEMQSLTEEMLECGATIFEINAVRKHLERLKGGRLAQIAAPARVISLVLSDVVGNPLNVIASGPTVADTSTYQEALQILGRYHLSGNIPVSIIRHLKKGIDGEVAETPKPGDALFERVSNFIIGSNRLACQAALNKASHYGLNTMLLTTYLQGEARQAGLFMAAIAREIDASRRPINRPACLVAGGETTVTITGDGLGGRNLEVALGAVNDLAGLRQVALVTLATDGGDGPTDAAGALVTGDSLRRASALGLTPKVFLAENDSYHFFEKLGDLLKPGPTQTNVNDLTFLFAF